MSAHTPCVEPSSAHGARPWLPHSVRHDTHLVGLDQNEDVVHPDRQHQEGDDLDHNEGEGDSNVAEDAQRAGHRAQHDEDARDAEGDLGIHLRHNKDTPAVSTACPTCH